MIEQLTKDQKEKMIEYRDKWIDIGLDTDRIDHSEAKRICNEVQDKLLGRKKTPVVVARSQIEAWDVVCRLHGVEDLSGIEGAAVEDIIKNYKKKDMQFVTPYLTGQNDAHVFSFYDFMIDELGCEVSQDLLEKYKIWRETSKLGWIWPLDNVCVVSEKPTKVKMKDGRLHCDGGPAFEYADGFCGWYLNGVKVSKELAETPAGQLDIELWRAEENADVKAEFVRKYGVERMLTECQLMDSYKNYDDEWWTKSEYELYDAKPLYEGITKHEVCPHLKMKNQSTGIWHVEGISPKCKSIGEALAWRESGKDKYGTIDIK